jgi:hypothetical protein
MRKLEFEVRDALLRYSKRPGKKIVKEVLRIEQHTADVGVTEPNVVPGFQNN